MTRIQFTRRERNALGVAIGANPAILENDERQALRELHAKMDAALAGRARAKKAARKRRRRERAAAERERIMPRWRGEP